MHDSLLTAKITQLVLLFLLTKKTYSLEVWEAQVVEGSNLVC